MRSSQPPHALLHENFLSCKKFADDKFSRQAASAAAKSPKGFELDKHRIEKSNGEVPATLKRSQFNLETIVIWAIFQKSAMSRDDRIRTCDFLVPNQAL